MVNELFLMAFAKKWEKTQATSFKQSHKIIVTYIYCFKKSSKICDQLVFGFFTPFLDLLKVSDNL